MKPFERQIKKAFKGAKSTVENLKEDCEGLIIEVTQKIADQVREPSAAEKIERGANKALKQVQKVGRNAKENFENIFDRIANEEVDNKLEEILKAVKKIISKMIKDVETALNVDLNQIKSYVIHQIQELSKYYNNAYNVTGSRESDYRRNQTSKSQAEEDLNNLRSSTIPSKSSKSIGR